MKEAPTDFEDLPATTGSTGACKPNAKPMLTDAKLAHDPWRTPDGIEALKITGWPEGLICVSEGAYSLWMDDVEGNILCSLEPPRAHDLLCAHLQRWMCGRISAKQGHLQIEYDSTMDDECVWLVSAWPLFTNNAWPPIEIYAPTLSEALIAAVLAVGDSK